MVAPGTFVPLTFHWYNGVVPPFTGVVEKVTWVPAQTGLAEADITILTGKEGLTFTAWLAVFEQPLLSVTVTA